MLARLERRGEVFALRFADEQVNVFRHDDIADDGKAIGAAGWLEHAKEKIAAARGVQKRKTTVAADSDEVQVPLAVVSLEITRHRGSLLPRQAKAACLGHPLLG